MSDLLRRALEYRGGLGRRSRQGVVFLGDYIDRGPNSRAVLDTLMAGPSRPNHVWTPLLGNHDQMMEQALAGDLSALENVVRKWGGTDDRLLRFRCRRMAPHPSRYINFIRKLQLVLVPGRTSHLRTCGSAAGRSF